MKIKKYLIIVLALGLTISCKKKKDDEVTPEEENTAVAWQYLDYAIKDVTIVFSNLDKIFVGSRKDAAVISLDNTVSDIPDVGILDLATVNPLGETVLVGRKYSYFYDFYDPIMYTTTDGSNYSVIDNYWTDFEEKAFVGDSVYSVYYSSGGEGNGNISYSAIDFINDTVTFDHYFCYGDTPSSICHTTLTGIPNNGNFIYDFYCDSDNTLAYVDMFDSDEIYTTTNGKSYTMSSLKGEFLKTSKDLFLINGSTLSKLKNGIATVMTSTIPDNMVLKFAEGNNIAGVVYSTDVNTIYYSKDGGSSWITKEVDTNYYFTESTAVFMSNDYLYYHDSEEEKLAYIAI